MPSHTCMACSTAHAHPASARLTLRVVLRVPGTELLLVARFDADCSLRCELARKNMYIREDPSVKRGRYEAPYPGYSQPAPYAPSYQGQRASSYAPITNTRDNPPCNTLFIGNLSESVSEAELRTLFGSQPGFTQLKLNRGGGNITCFVEFIDLPTAMACHSGQQVGAACHLCCCVLPNMIVGRPAYARHCAAVPGLMAAVPSPQLAEQRSAPAAS